jgi:hypothetical protein
MEAVVMNKWRWDSLQAVAILCAALLGGCVMHSVTRGDSNAASHTIYLISEEEAFITILDIFAIELPNQSVDDVIEGKYRGYNATARFWMDWTDHRVLVIPAKGVAKDGRHVQGYWYDIRSSGSRMIENPLRHNRIREAIQQKLGKTAVVVTNLQDGEYETSGEAYLGRKRDARDIKAERERKTSKGVGSSGRAWVLWKRLLDAHGQPVANGWSPTGGFESQADCEAEKRRLTTGSPVCLPDTIDPRGAKGIR